MKDTTGVVLVCEECGSDRIITDYIRSETYCDKCGLVKDPTHKMGSGINGLVSYMSHNSLSQHTEDIRTLATFNGLRAARLAVSKLE